MTARSTSETPKPASRGGQPRSDAVPSCIARTACQSANTLSAPPAATAWAHAVRITSFIASISSSNDVAGFFVNHFGGRLSAARPV
jgi:hypothetical protein